MNKVSEVSLEKGELRSVDGRVFYQPGKPVLDSLPQDLVTEMSRRRLAELHEYQAEREFNRERRQPRAPQS
jgi:hypothetical protein